MILKEKYVSKMYSWELSSILCNSFYYLEDLILFYYFINLVFKQINLCYFVLVLHLVLF